MNRVGHLFLERFPALLIWWILASALVAGNAQTIMAALLLHLLAMPAPARLLHRLLSRGAPEISADQPPCLVLAPMAGCLADGNGGWVAHGDSAARVSRAAAEAKRLGVPLAIIGGRLADGASEAEIAARAVDLDGVAEVLMASDAPNTRMTAAAAAELAAARGCRRVLAVTQPTHMARVAACLRAQGLAVSGAITPPDHAGWRGPWDLVPSTGALLLLQRGLYECAAILAYLARGHFRFRHLIP